jgi:hypothetical protein
LPQLTGEPIGICCQSELSAHRGKLLSGNLGLGTPVHAASFIRERKIILEAKLVGTSGMLRLIFVHELFHFVWTRLGNKARNEFANLLFREWMEGARGELGESSSVKKHLMGREDAPSIDSRLWRDYVCESFCDTAAWLYAGVKDHAAFTLSKRYRSRREAYFRAIVGTCCKC